jgi:DNA-binding transcriptional ArsR family regulator
VAQNEEAGSGEPGGFFKLSHTLFADPRIQQMSGDCFRLFLWLSMRAWRFPDSTGVVRASVRFVEEATGMGHATISRALKVLKDHELVEALEVDYKRGNVWKIARLALPGGAPDPKPRKKLTHKELPQSEAPFFSTEAPSNRARTRLEMSAQVPQNEDQYKKYKNLKKHSQDALGVFFDRLAKIGAPRKRETELSSLDSLLATFSPEQIEAALNHVEAKGTLKGERCHSPFTYLSLAMDDVLRRLQPTKHATAAPAIPSNDDADAEQRRAALAIFESELSTETQESFIARYTESEYLHGFVPPPTVVRSFAAAAWFAARLSGGKITLFAQPFEARHEADNRIPVVVRVIDWNDRLRLEPGSCDAQRVQDG